MEPAGYMHKCQICKPLADPWLHNFFVLLLSFFERGFLPFLCFGKHKAIWNRGERKSVWVGRIFLASAFASLRLLCLCGLSIVFFLFLSKDLTDYVLTKVETSAAFAIVFIRIQVRFFGPFFGPFPDFRPLVLFPC